MTLVEINARKAELVKKILNDVNTEEQLTELELFLGLNEENAQCQASIEEVYERFDRAVKAFDRGEGISLSDIKRKEIPA